MTYNDDPIRDLNKNDRQALIAHLLKLRDRFQSSGTAIAPWANERIIELLDALQEEEKAFADLALRARSIGTAYIVDEEDEADGQR